MLDVDPRLLRAAVFFAGELRRVVLFRRVAVVEVLRFAELFAAVFRFGAAFRFVAVFDFAVVFRFAVDFPDELLRRFGGGGTLPPFLRASDRPIAIA